MERAAEAAREGDLQYFSGIAPEELRRLCDKKDEDGRSLLHAAAVSGSLPLLQLLLDHGAGAAVNSGDEAVRRGGGRRRRAPPGTAAWPPR